MAKAKLKFRLHRTVIVLICLTLLVVLMQGASWFSLGHQMARSEQVEELAHTLTRQVAWSLTPLMENPDDNHQRIIDSLNQMTHESRILDASLGEALRTGKPETRWQKRPGRRFLRKNCCCSCCHAKQLR